ncbi:unnamed protein product [Miscanthus lutarioriparius]|uniref:Uncharacterized protein n=1 Tax=Miscanthus lutarioriparius TaxID=422564 RepID=A0A811R7P4_9POAL|nr:unnamed protein product [Miscanthus lutarioriparius]
MATTAPAARLRFPIAAPNKMNSATLGLCVVAIAVPLTTSVDSLEQDPLMMCFALALCVAFHRGIALIVRGLSCRDHKKGELVGACVPDEGNKKGAAMAADWRRKGDLVAVDRTWIEAGGLHWNVGEQDAAALCAYIGDEDGDEEHREHSPRTPKLRHREGEDTPMYVTQHTAAKKLMHPTQEEICYP